MTNLKYHPRERLFLWCVALISFFVLNGAFLYALIFDQPAIVNALKNPVSVAFIGEAFLLMATMSFLLSKWGVSKLSLRFLSFCYGPAEKKKRFHAKNPGAALKAELK